MKKFIIGSLAALVATVSLASTADAGWRHRPGNRQTDRRVFFRSEHLLREDPARFCQTGGIERLKALIDQMANFFAAFGAIKTDGLAGKSALG